MSVAVLDINVLLALAWPNHVHHNAAHVWLAEKKYDGWATCPHTELGFLRLSMQPAVVKTAVTFEDALKALTISTSAPEHVFWPEACSFAAIADEIRARIAGHHQLADAMLLDLAIRHAGKLATFDLRIASLLPPDSANRSVVTSIPV